MRYYKIVKNNEFIGVISDNNFFMANSNQLLAVNNTLGQYVEYEGQLYRDYWMIPITTQKYNFLMADIKEISQEDFFICRSAKQQNKVIQTEEDIEIPIEEEQQVNEEPKNEDEMLEFVRSSKISIMSNACHKTIEQGFDLELRGETKHFSLDTQDQLNLMSLSTLDSYSIPYHADGEEVVFYSPNEIQQIVSAANAFKIYHTTYYNSLKNYINSLETIEEIAAIEYGVDIPEEYQSDVLKALGR